MTHSKKALTLGMAVLFAAALTGLVHGQVPGATRPEVAANAAVVAEGNQHTQQLIAHALDMAINGSDLQLIARAAGQGGPRQGQGQGQDRNRNANDRDDDNANRDNDNRRNDGDRNQGDRGANSQADRQTGQLLERQAWQQFEDSNQLLRAAHQDLTAQENAANVRDNDRAAWARRLYSAANQYATTLRNLSGISSRQPGSLGGEGQNDQDRNRGDNQNQGRNRGDNQDRDTARNQDQNRNSGQLNRTDAVRVALINQAVREAIEAFELNNQNPLGGANRVVAVNTPAQQQLQDHARRMAADSNQVLQRVLATLNQRDDQDPQNNRNRQDNRDQQGNRRGTDNARVQDDNNANDPQGQNRNQNQGQASVQLLAQQAQQVIDTLQRINPGLGAPTR